MTKTTQNEALSFEGMGIKDSFLDVLKKANFIHPTPIQHQSIPVAIEGKDIIGIAQTGTGKTLAFGIPMIQRLALLKKQGLILVPTRELALQVQQSLERVGSQLGLRTALIIGGQAMGKQIHALKKQPHIIIATPGRLNDHLQKGTFKLDLIKIFVLDEADRMFDMGFLPQIKEVLTRLPKERQTLLFSATMPPEITNIATTYMAMPVRIEVAPAGTASKNVEQEIFVVKKDEKTELLRNLLKEYTGTILIFSRTKHGAKRITQNIQKWGDTAAEIHSNKSLSQRLRALSGFKTGKFRVLVATDIAARGIDVKNISLVINFDLPDNSEDYVHRIGRTGRAGHLGKAISFATPDQKGDIKNIERLIQKTLPVGELPATLTQTKFSESLGTQNSGRKRPYRSNSRRKPFSRSRSGSRQNAQPRNKR